MKVSQDRQLDQNRPVCRIFKSLYNLKQVGRLWNKTVIKFLWKLGFDIINRDTYILIMVFGRDFIIVEIYVNNFLLGSRSHVALEWLKDQLIKKFQTKNLDEVKTIIKWEITRDMEAKTLTIN